MRVAVISDIHANQAAIEATLGAIERAGVTEVWCLGDLVGYGAEPDACVELVRDRCAVCLVGNHDLAVLGSLDIGSFSESAAAAVAWTRQNVAPSTLEYLEGLEPAGSRDGIGLFHASPRDPIWEYVLSEEQASACLDVQAERIGLIGHSHRALFFSRAAADRDRVQGAGAGDGTRLDLDDGGWLINPGSVGQPRDGDPRAAWLELDTEAQQATFHRVGYDIRRTAESIAAAGLPARLAARLFIGQ